jgi:D-arabinose 1-dehydrogenase-like Zn-dependent alcohol dehydrogenase
MRAVRLHGVGDVRLDQVDVPAASPGFVTVAVAACGICGSDVHFIDGSAHTGHVPITLGHEVAGMVVVDPSGSFEVGTPVVAEVGRFCRDCPRCAEGRFNLCQRGSVLGIHVDGGLADFVSVPTESVLPSPPGLNPAAAATAVDAGATAFHAITRRAVVAPGETVVIIGAGGLGGYGLQFARRAGAGAVIVVDTDSRALDAARALGADEMVLVAPGESTGRAIKLLTDGGADAAIEFVGAAASVTDAIKSIRPGGRAVVVGVGMEPITTLPAVLWSNNEYTLMGSYGSLPGDAATVLDMLADGSVQSPPTWEATLEEAPEILMGLAAGTETRRGRPVVLP